MSAKLPFLLITATIAALVFAFFSASVTGSTKARNLNLYAWSAQAPPLYVGIDQYRHWAKLSYLEVGDRVWGQSTADPAGTNADNSHIMRVLTDGQHLLFEQIGPGVMTWMRNQQNYGGPWKLSLDGALVATVDASDLGQLNPGSFPAHAMPYPLSMNIPETEGSSILAVTIPYSESMRWASVNPNGNFYSLYRKLPYGYPISTWTGAEPISDVVQLIRQAGTDIAPTDIFSQSGVVNIPSGETNIANLNGPGQVRAIKFRVPYADKVRFGNSRLRIYWDGEANPSVDAPVKFMVGDGAGVYQPAGRPLVKGWIAGAGGDGSSYMDFNLYWPMPFTGTARIAISSALTNTISSVAWNVRHETFTDPSGWWGNFHANYTSVPNPPSGQDMTFLDVTGSGKVVGTVVNFTYPDGTLEGDPHFFIDDNNTPQVQVTGTEEWGTGGNYWNGGNQTTLPVGGLPSSNNNPAGEDVDGSALYRFLISDAIPFNKHIVLRWEHGPANDVNDHPYRATVMWYGNPHQTALLSDDLVVSDPISRILHGYQSPAATYYTLTAAYEYPVHNPLSTASGISTTGVTTFTLTLDPANVGAFLRRQFDYGAPNQRARIFVDGQPAGTWYTGGYFNGNDIDGRVRRWREEEFPLPASLTSGKSSIVVRVEFVPTTDPPNTYWTEFRYQLYSFVMPPDSDPPTPTPTLSPTATSIATASRTRTATSTPTWTLTLTLAATSTRSDTPTRTSTPISSATRTATYTWTVSPTDTMLLPTGTTLASTPTGTATMQPPASPTLIATVCAIEFTDVSPGNTFYEQIRCLACRGVVMGYPCGGIGEPCDPPNHAYFRPQSYVTRGQLAKIVAQAAGISEPVEGQSYEDVQPGTTFYLYIERLSRLGVVSGYVCGSTPSEPCVPPANRPYFRPNTGASRGQLTKIAANTAGFADPAPDSNTFADVPVGSTYHIFVERLLLHRPSVMQGYPCGGAGEPCDNMNRAYFRPGNNVTRGQTAKIAQITFLPNCITPDR